MPVHGCVADPGGQSAHSPRAISKITNLDIIHDLSRRLNCNLEGEAGQALRKIWGEEILALQIVSAQPHRLRILLVARAVILHFGCP